MHSNETPEESRESSEVSASEVPINHMMDIDDSDSDFEHISSDDESVRDYQLLSEVVTTQESAESGGQQTLYYPHSYTVEWLDWDQYEQTLENSPSSADDNALNTSTDRSDAANNSESTDSAANQTTEPSNECQNISLTDDQIDVIKTLMSGFTLPKDNIPVWAQGMPEDQWKELLSRQIEANKEVDHK